MDIEEYFINYIGIDGMNYYCCEADEGEYQKDLDGKFNSNTRTTVLSLISKHSSGVDLSFKQKELMNKLNKGD